MRKAFSLAFHDYLHLQTLNYIDQQEYNRAIQQLRYYSAIKEHYDLMMQEERTIQELDYLKRCANEVVYPAIDKARQVKEDYLKTRERGN